jgi:predicted metal-dependent hydrolase
LTARIDRSTGAKKKMLTTQSVPRPRSAPVTFEEGVPRRWFADLAVASHIVNGVNLLFPAGERFFVRSVHHYLGQIEDPLLREQVKGFFGQEGRHAHAHERFFEVLEAQGYEIAPFLEAYESFVYGQIEPRTSPELRLSVTVALEHFTAILAANALSDGLLDLAHPTMRGLLLWHAAEEIEHRSVAFDVLKAVAPSYPLRMAGMALATVALGGYWIAATAMLLQQDRKQGERGAFRAFRRVDRRGTIAQRVFLRGIKEYIRRDFHPSQNDIDGLASAYLTKMGIA